MQRALAPLVAALVLASCSDDSKKAPVTPSGPSSHQGAYAPPSGGEAVLLDLRRDLGGLESATETEYVDVGSWAQRRQLLDGWSFPGHGEDTAETIGSAVWSDATTAAVGFWSRDAGVARTLVFEVSPYLPPGTKEAGELHVSLNGERIDSFDLVGGFREHEVDLPKRLVVAGHNEIAFEMPHAIRPKAVDPDSGEMRTLSAVFRRLHLVYDTKAVAEREKELQRALPRGSAPGASSGSVEQQVGTSLVAYFASAGDARLVGECVVVPGEGSLRFDVVATDDAGGRVALDPIVCAADGEALPFELDLAASELTAPVRLEFSVTAMSDDAPTSGNWIDVRVLGEATAPPTDDAPDALARLREALKGRDVVTILIDAAHPKYISGLGGREGLTPVLEGLVDDGIAFTEAQAQASYTLSSIPSNLTGLYAWEHGAHEERTSLTDEWPTWPEAFDAAGYLTAGIVHSPNGSSVFGYDRGFEEYVDIWKGERESDFVVPRITDALPALDRILNQRGDDPLFLWMHVVEPHEPYLPPDPWRFQLASDAPGILHGTAETLWGIRRWDIDPTEADVRNIELGYEENYAYGDWGLERLFERLDASGVGPNAIIAIFSDHGEGFLEHDGKVHAGMGHGSTVYDEMTRIPMILRLPKDLDDDLRAAGVKRDDLVGGFDLLATLADLVGVEPIEGMSAVSFARAIADGAPSREWLASHSASRQAKRFVPSAGLWWRDYKLVAHSGDRPELYDLSNDPGERTNLAAERPVTTGYLMQRFRLDAGYDPQIGGAQKGGEAATLDAETMKQLQELGYAGK